MVTMRRTAVVALGVLLLAGCGARDADALPSSTPTGTPTPSPTFTQTIPPEPTPAPTTYPGSYTYSCDVGGDYREFADYHDVWAVGVPVDYCDSRAKARPPTTDLEASAMTVAYGSITQHGLQTLYGLCAKTAGIPWDQVVSEPQAAEAAGALVLCPDHPRAADFTAAAAAMRGEQQLIAEGKLLYSGRYLVGSEAAPGTWQSEGDRVENCYWEVADQNGDIIDNGLISVSDKVTITVPSTATGLTISGCSFRWVGP